MTPKDGGRGPTTAAPGPLERLVRRDALRQAAVDLATAHVLERRADRSGSQALADLLRARAGERRRRAERLRARAGLPRSRA